MRALTGVEALAGYRFPDETRSGVRFTRFVCDYFLGEYQGVAKDLWDFRNGMIHGFCPRRFALTHHMSHLNLRNASDEAIILNAEEFYGALLHAARRYFAELEGSAELNTGFIKRLQSPQGGGIAVGPVNVV